MTAALRFAERSYKAEGPESTHWATYIEVRQADQDDETCRPTREAQRGQMLDAMRGAGQGGVRGARANPRRPRWSPAAPCEEFQFTDYDPCR